jgi:hypothetical protein
MMSNGKEVVGSDFSLETLVNRLYGVPDWFPFDTGRVIRVTDQPNDAGAQPATKTDAWLLKPTLATLSAALRANKTITDLFKLANDDEFKLSVARIGSEDVKSLRLVYKEMQTSLDGKVRLETFDGQVVNIVGIDWWHSDAYDNDGVSLHIRSEREPDTKVKALTSSAPVVTFCNRLRELPTESKPIRVMLSLQPVRDAERAARGQKIWSVKLMPPARGQGVDGSVPF